MSIHERSVYVSDLAKQLTEDDIADLFKGVGKVIGVYICVDVEGKSTGAAYVTLESPQHAATAVTTLGNQLTLMEVKHVRRNYILQCWQRKRKWKRR